MTTEAPKRIWAWPHFDGWITGDWSANTYHDERTVAYILASEHARIVAEKDAEIERLRAALQVLTTDPRDDSVCIGDGWSFYTDAIEFARKALGGNNG